MFIPTFKFCGIRKQNGSHCRVPTLHLFEVYFKEITGTLTLTFWLNCPPFTFIVILNLFIDFSKNAPDNYRIWSTFSINQLKCWIWWIAQENARFTVEGRSQPCVLISSLDAIVLSGKHMSSAESPKLSVGICQHILHHLACTSHSQPYTSFPHISEAPTRALMQLGATSCKNWWPLWETHIGNYIVSSLELTDSK